MSITVLLFALSATTYAQNYTGLNGPFGGGADKMVTLPNGRLVACKSNAGVFWSNDSGATWTKGVAGINDFGFWDMIVDNGTIYLLTETRLFTSTDGQTWTVAASTGFTNARFIRKSSQSGNFFIVSASGSPVTGNKVYRSTNGTSWIERYQFMGTFVNTTDVEITSAGILLIATSGNGIFRAPENDLSATNIKTAQGLSTDDITGLTLSGTDVYALTSNGPNKSINGGSTFTSVINSGIACCFFNQQIATDPAGAIYLTQNSTIWKTINGGTSWTTVASPITGFGDAVSMHFISATTFFVSIKATSIFKTTNSGAGWITSDSGFTGLDGKELLFTDNGRLLMTRQQGLGLHLTTDDGATWDHLTTGNLQRNLIGLRKIPGGVLAYGTGIVKSVDNGANWTLVHSGSSTTNLSGFANLLTNDGTNLYTIDQFDGATGSSNWGLWKSVNGGTTFARTTITGMPSTASYIVNETNDIILDTSGNIYILANNFAAGVVELYKVVVATGVGTKITTLNANIIYDIDVNNGKLYAVLQNAKLMVSSDQGATWIEKTFGNDYNKLRVYNDNTLFTFTNIISVSKDAAATWTQTGTLDATNGSNVADLKVSTANFAYTMQRFSRVYKSGTQVVPPATPTALMLLANGPKGVALQWNDNSADETGFSIEASLNDNLHYAQAATASRPNGHVRAEGFTYVTGLQPGATYFFRVRAVGPGGSSVPSNEVQMSLPADCSASSTIPINRSWTASSLNQSGTNVSPSLNERVELAFTTPGELYVYNIALGVGSTLNPQPDDPVGAFLTDNCGAVFFSAEDFVQQQWIPNGAATWDATTKKITIPIKTHPRFALRSETIVYTMNTVDPVPDIPVGLTAGVYTANNNLIGWDQGVAFVVKYEIERSTSAASGYVKVGEVDYKTFSYRDADPALVGGTIYHYRIRAVNGSGASGYSASASVAPNASPLFAPFDNVLSKMYFTSMTGGAWGDVDGDGIEDLVIGASQDSVLTNQGPLVFKSRGNGQFIKFPIAELANEKTANYRGAAILDINNDGRNDLFLNRPGGIDYMLIKQANGSYNKSPMPYPATATGLSNAMWIDLENDGDLDLATGSDANSGADVFLFKNDGQGVLSAFTDSEITTATNGGTRNMEFADFDNDGLIDVLKLNRISAGKTTLYRNTGGGNLKQVAASAFETIVGGQRTASWGDIDNDGDLDVFVGTSSTITAGAQNYLFKNEPGFVFSAVSTGDVAETTPTFGSAFADIDNDTDLDLIISTNEGNRIYINSGNGTFTKTTSTELFTNPNIGKLYGLAMADVDNDGFLDMYNGGFSGPNIPNFLYRNTTAPSASRNWLKFKLTGATSNKSAIGARLKLTAGGKTMMRFVQSHTAYSTQSSLIQHFGLGAATNATLTIYWPSGIVQTRVITEVNKTFEITEDGAGPIAATLTPANGSNPIGVTKLEILYNEEPFAVNDKKITVTKLAALTPEHTLLATAGVKDGNKITFTLPAKLAQSTAYQIALDAGAFEDVYGNDVAAIAVASWSFQTGADPDSGPPTITYDPAQIATLEKGGTTTAKMVSITASDDKAVTSFIFYHRKIGETAFENAAITGATFEVNINMADDMGMEYYFEAKDAAANTARNPAAANTYHRSIVQFTGNARATIPIPSEGTEQSWKIIAIPYDLSTMQTSQIFNDLGPAGAQTWRLLRYGADVNGQHWVEFPTITTIERGKGYFINSKLQQKTIVLGDPKSPNYTRDNLFKMNLVQGWNQIGNPYTTTLNWNDVRNFSTSTPTVKELYLYSNGQYVKNPELLRETGGFVFATQAVNNLPIPFPGQSPSRTKGFDFGPLDSDSWRIDMILTNGDRKSATGGVGMNPESSNSYDEWDDFNPPRFTDYLEMNFHHPEFFYKLFGRDVVKTTDEHIWEFEVETNLDGATTLSWDNSLMGDGAKNLFLYDVETQTPTDMKANTSYSFNPKAGRRFRVYYGEDVLVKIKPAKPLLGNAYPNPAVSFATIPFSIPEALSPSKVKLEIFDMIGRRVSTVVDDHLSGGFYKAHWVADEARDSNGFYIYRLTVDDEVLSGRVLLKR